MSVLDDKANEVSASLAAFSGMEAGPASPFLDFLKQLFTKLLPLLLTCLPVASRNGAGMAKSLNNPNLRQRLGLRWQLRKEIDDPRTGNLTAGQIEGALMKMGAGCNEADATAMMSEVA